MSSRTSLVFRTDASFAIKVAFGLFVAAVSLVPSCIAVVQWLARPAGAEPTDAIWSAVPGFLIVAWGVTYSATREEVVVDPNARTVAWRVTAFGVPYRVVTWPWSDVTSIHVQLNGSFRSGGRRADATGPGGTRTVFHYFHRRPPEEIQEMATLLGVPLVDKT